MSSLAGIVSSLGGSFLRNLPPAAREMNSSSQEEVIELPPSGTAEVIGPLADYCILKVMSPTVGTP